MKRITRMLIFSSVALYLTSLWNKGFLINYQPDAFLKTIILVALFYYLVLPLTKLILLPINLLTLGLVSTLVYFLLFYLFFSRFALVKIAAWDFEGLSFLALSLKPTHIGSLANIFLSSISLSVIINFLEKLL